jgi:hypothetical protein
LDDDFLEQFPILPSGRIKVKVSLQDLDVEEIRRSLGRIENDRVARRDAYDARVGLFPSGPRAVQARFERGRRRCFAAFFVRVIGGAP